MNKPTLIKLKNIIEDQLIGIGKKAQELDKERTELNQILNELNKQSELSL